QFISLFLTTTTPQKFLQFGSRPGETRHHRARWDLRDLGYFLVGKAFLVTQHQDLAKFRRQSVDRVLHQRGVFGLFEKRGWTGRFVGSVVHFFIERSDQVRRFVLL